VWQSRCCCSIAQKAVETRIEAAAARGRSLTEVGISDQGGSGESPQPCSLIPGLFCQAISWQLCFRTAYPPPVVENLVGVMGQQLLGAELRNGSSAEGGKPLN
jgi:hypothetical protein